MREQIYIKGIKKALKDNYDLVERYKKRSDLIREYTGNKKDNRWRIMGKGVYDSPVQDFGIRFNTVLPEDYRYVKEGNFSKTYGKNFKKYIEETLSKGEKRDLYAVEFGGPGTNLFNSFTINFFRQTAGVCLEETDISDTKNSNHSVIKGNILGVIGNEWNELVAKITQKLGADKTDLIISKMERPLVDINKHPAIVDRIIRNWYDILNENGLMFIQFEYHANESTQDIKTSMLKKWATIIQEKCPEIDIQIGDNGTLRLHKKIGAPEKLPPATQLLK